MNNLLLFAGTTEGREIVGFLRGSDVNVFACVATEYGKTVLEEGGNIHVLSGRLTVGDMISLAKEKDIQLVIDATHPFATFVSANIKEMCHALKLPFFRVRREADSKMPQAIYVKDIREAVAYLKGTKGNILITTGSKELHPYCEVPEYQKRCYVRVLSTMEAVKTCVDCGFEGAHLIAMQGPHSYEMNLALLLGIHAKYLVTKESGMNGGYEAKMQAASQAGVTPIVIGRPKEEGDTVAAICRMLHANNQIQRQIQVTLIGIGPGKKTCLTAEAQEIIAQAELVIGAARMIAAVGIETQRVYEAYQAEEIKNYIADHPNYRRIAIVLSGDVSFYSGAKKLLDVLPPTYQTKLLPGISSVAYLAAKLQVSMEDTKLLSIHGRRCNAVDYLRRYGKIFLLVSGGQEVLDFLFTLCELGYEDAFVAVGSRLSYTEEKIQRGTAKTLCQDSFHSLSVVFASINRTTKRACFTPGIPDSHFMRGKVPMTKQDVRAVILGRLQIAPESIVYDVGAGTGSVSIEMAMQAIDGTVYAVEKSQEGVRLIHENKKQFHVSNIEVVDGEAPDALEELPPPTHAFIGGSGSRLIEIIEVIRTKNPKVRIVISAITLNTITACMNYFDAHTELTPQIVQVQVSQAREVGAYQMMEGQNPITIFVC